MSNSTKIQISEDLMSRLTARMSKTQYQNLSEYAEFILEEVVNEMESDGEAVNTGTSVDEVEDRLKSLGYLSN